MPTPPALSSSDDEEIDRMQALEAALAARGELDEDDDDDDDDEEEEEEESDSDEDQRGEHDLLLDLFQEAQEYNDAVDDDDDDDDEFQDAESNIVFQVVEGENAATEPADADAASETNDEVRNDITQRILRLISSRRLGMHNQRQFLEFLRNSNNLVFDYGADGDETDLFGAGRRRRQQDPNRFPKVPSEKGRELMDSGTFGATDHRSPMRARKRIARRLLDRELGVGNEVDRKVNQHLIAQSMLPSSDAEMIIHYEEPVYSGQFSDDGSFFYSCVKDFKVRMYDTSNPYNWRHYKTVRFPWGSWTLTDASLSPDNKWLAYTSIQSNVCLAPTDPNDTGDPYSLDLGAASPRRGGFRGAFGIWSIRFSGDGRELVAGTNSNSMVVYDIESRRVLHEVTGHDDHVNAVCFADKSSPHILYSGSDDATIKVWDRRSMGDGREAGAFVGHIEGLTYIDSKGDGRYILSNAKDQSMKLWDLKMMHTTAKFEELNPRQHTRYSDFDYRWNRYDDRDWFAHPNDNSVVTFRGHQVLRTLIRCHFSPPNSTDSRYVYTGSHDGKVHIYNMDATKAGEIDVLKTTKNTRAVPRQFRNHMRRVGFDKWQTCVRDASWHPNAPFIAASSLNGPDHQLGTVTLHSYNETERDEGLPRMGTGYDDRMRLNRGGFSDDEEDEGEDDEDEDEDADYSPHDDDEEEDEEDGWLG